MTRMPSWADYATHNESQYPELWEGCIGAWCPGLGATGGTLPDLSLRQHPGTLENMTLASAWTAYQGQSALVFTGIAGTGRDAATILPAGGTALTSGLAKGTILATLMFTGAIASSASFFFESTSSSGHTRFGLAQRASPYEGQISLGLRDSNTGTSVSVLGNKIGSTSEFFTSAVVFDSDLDYMNIYMYGDYDTTVNASFGPVYAGTSASKSLIGSSEFGVSSQACKARIADVRLYDRVLDAEEIRLYERVRLAPYLPRLRRRFISIPRFNPAFAAGSNIILPAGVSPC